MLGDGRTVTLMTDLLSAAGMVAAMPTTRDFSKPRKRLAFTIDGDTFEAAPALPGDVYAQFVMLSAGTGERQTYQEQYLQMKSALELVLLPESHERFVKRLADKLHPIDEDQMNDVLLWLMEEYGMRPTQPSQPSSDGQPSPESGTSSTDEQQQQDSIPATFLPTGS